MRRRATNPAANAWRASTRCFANARAKPPWSYTALAQPGDVLTRYERDVHRNPSEVDRGELDEVGWPDLSFAIACVRSRNGFTGRLLLVHRTAHDYSEMERAELGALAELASLVIR